MLTLPIQAAKYENGIDPMHATTNGCHVDPRSMAQRILAVSRCQDQLQLAACSVWKGA